MIKHLLVAFVLAASVTLGQAQSKISDLLAQADARWMVGQWEAQTDRGDVITLQCSLDLDGAIGIIHVKAPNMELKGVSHVDPDTLDPKYLGFSLDGNVTTGTWSDLYGNLLLTAVSRHASAGQTWRGGVVFRRVTANTMRIEMHNLTAAGNLIYPATGTVEFKRKS